MSAPHNKAAAMKCTDGSVQFGPQSCYIRIKSPPPPLCYYFPSPSPPLPLYMNNTNVFSSSRLENKISQQDSDPCLWLYKPMTAKPREQLHEESAFVCFSGIYQCTEASVCVCVSVSVSVQMRPKEPHVAFCHWRGWSCCSRSAYQYSAHQTENQRPGMYFPGHFTGSGPTAEALVWQQEFAHSHTCTCLSYFMGSINQ